MVNVSHHDTETQKQKTFFDKPVLIKTLYYPSFSKDTLNYEPVNRNYFMISVYDEDTNKDGFLNVKDLRRFYHFDINANNKRNLTPANYSIYKSEYDPSNDLVYIFAQLDENQNGLIDDGEDVHIFWIDLKNPERTWKAILRLPLSGMFYNTRMINTFLSLVLTFSLKRFMRIIFLLSVTISFNAFAQSKTQKKLEQDFVDAYCNCFVKIRHRGT